MQDSDATPEVPPEFNFKQRVEAFWAWFAGVAERFHQTIEEKRCGDLSDEVSDKVDELLPGMAWVFGPGSEPGCHSFTLSGEGIAAKQILAAHWLSRAPAIDSWTFHGSRQPASDAGSCSFNMGDLSFKPIEFWVTPEIDEEEERIDITLWHPLADQAQSGLCTRALFLILDEIFGEFGTCRWIGTIEFSQKRLSDSMPISELKDFVDEASLERGWKMRSPGDDWSSYSIPSEKRNGRPRMDTIAGATACWEVLKILFRDPDQFEDPFAEYFAEWIYLSIPSAVLPKDNLVDARETMADVISEELERQQSGMRLGGAIGTERSYLDFLIYDGSRSIGVIREVARAAGLPADARVEFLDATKRDQGHPLFGG